MRLKNVKGANEIIIKGTHYIDNPYQNKGNWQKLFNNDNPIHIEIGIGKGDFIIQLALQNSNINYIGIEKYDSVIVRAIQKSNELDITNLKIIRMDADKLEEVFSKEIDTIYLNFSDTWPKDINYSIESLTSHGYTINYQTNDLHKENIPNIMTEYERKFTKKGIKINKLDATKD